MASCFAVGRNKSIKMNIWQDFLTNDAEPITKWMHYFPIYEKHFSEWRNKTITFLEIGVFQGGSLQMWERFFGPLATIVGIDIDPECKKYEADNIHIRIGDQSDPGFLSELISEFGEFDIILDDGSHRMDHILETFIRLYPNTSKNGLYCVEDLHTAYWEEYGGGVEKQETFINVCKGFIDELNAEHSRGIIEPTFITKFTTGLHFYDSVVVFERGTIPIRRAIRIPQ